MMVTVAGGDDFLPMLFCYAPLEVTLFSLVIYTKHEVLPS